MTSQQPWSSTHPWISFQLNLNHLDYETWMLLGAIESKCEHLANALIGAATGEELRTVYLAKGVQATAAIEGNTLSEEQVRARMARIQYPSRPTDDHIPESQAYQAQEIDNLVRACNWVADQILRQQNDAPLTVETLENFNGMVLKDLALEEGVFAGAVRRHNVGVSDYRAPDHAHCRLLLEQLCDWLNDFVPEGAKHRIAMAVVKAVVSHVYIAWTHPFGDGNGRTARLVEVQTLLQAGVPDVAAHLLSNHYNKTRSEYYRQLGASWKTNGRLGPFIKCAAQGLFDQLNEQIATVREFQNRVAWGDYARELVARQRGEAGERQQQLAIALGDQKKPCPQKELARLTPDLAAHYAKKNDRTLLRDLAALESLQLIRWDRDNHLVQANRDLMLKFKPLRRE